MDDSDRAAWSIDEWIATMPFKKTFLYELWRTGRGPRRVTLGGRAIIVESPRDFMQRNQPTPFVGWQAPQR